MPSQLRVLLVCLIHVVLLGGTAGAFWYLWSFAQHENLTFCELSSFQNPRTANK
jgi:hypothetical protein